MNDVSSVTFTYNLNLNTEKQLISMASKHWQLDQSGSLNKFNIKDIT